MKRKNKINLGLSESASKFLDHKSKKTVLIENGKAIVTPIKELDRRLGDLSNIRLHRYELDCGKYATEFLQCCMPSEDGDTLVFLGLETESKRFTWPYSKIMAEINSRCMN